ncbi:dynein beta chain, ciliary-like isoform X2 [Phycodurus eques]|uniref:dynein beta chain, ciliary-like isoform X2 n=1 Tax=Phycodurus eques TaxID=693459 RepID=UPI002ACEC7EB|nr:dynein beta chain, ciliary-like isoform X2 [Phycodurus eques]
MERLKNRALVVKAQKEGWTFLPLPKRLHDDQERTPCDVKLLHACEGLIVEWAGLVSDFLRQNPARPLAEGLEPRPSEEFDFWSNRLRNLELILQQMTSGGARRVASLLGSAEGAYRSALKDMHADAQKGTKRNESHVGGRAATSSRLTFDPAGLAEAQDADDNLRPLRCEVERLELLEYPQLRDNMAAVMQTVRRLWIGSRFHCKPCWIVVLLQEICNLFIHRSREFLNGQEVMRGLVSDPARVLDDVRVVTLTLQTLKDKYIHHRMLLEQQVSAHFSQFRDLRPRDTSQLRGTRGHAHSGQRKTLTRSVDPTPPR